MAKSLILGISGGSGSGKTTLARLFQSVLGEETCAWLAQDRYYRTHAPELRGRINYDHPDAIEFDLLASHLEALKRGEDIMVPSYDFATHARHEAMNPFQARPIVVVDGILILSQPSVRDLLDYSFFVDTHEDLRFSRRLNRDVRERGRSSTSVREQFFTQVKPMHDSFVEPSRQFADRIVSGAVDFRPMVEAVIFGLKDHPDRLMELIP